VPGAHLHLLQVPHLQHQQLLLLLLQPAQHQPGWEVLL
jgi:hypothetical protein